MEGRFFAELAMDTPKRKRSATGVPRNDGRKSILVYLDADLLKQLKVTAVLEERPAWELVEQAVRAHFHAASGKRKV
jgi:hypothetical protein